MINNLIEYTINYIITNYNSKKIKNHCLKITNNYKLNVNKKW